MGRISGTVRNSPLTYDGLVEQAEDRRGQQNDERPNHAPDHPLENVDPGSLGFNFSFDLSDLSLEPSTLRVDLRTLRINLSSENGDLGSENGNNILSGQAAVFFGGFVGQVGVHVHATQRSEECLR